MFSSGLGTVDLVTLGTGAVLMQNQPTMLLVDCSFAQLFPSMTDQPHPRHSGSNFPRAII